MAATPIQPLCEDSDPLANEQGPERGTRMEAGTALLLHRAQQHRRFASECAGTDRAMQLRIAEIFEGWAAVREDHG